MAASAASIATRIPAVIMCIVLASSMVSIAFADMAERLKPRDLEMIQDEATNQMVAKEKQFFHLHHMKTGGTSINSLINCALRRFTPLHENVPFFSLSECSGKSYIQCIEQEDNHCRPKVNSSAAMSYCAPLFQTNQFEWNQADAVTVIRHPVDRVWSMFRFQTLSCYECRNLTDIYAELDENGITDGKGRTCQVQLMNHQTRNLLTSPADQNFTEEEKLAEALHNINSRFAIVGLTEELPTFATMLGHTFPWLAEHLESDGDDHKNDCKLRHANSSPKNNRCGPRKTHWNLPDHPDEETRQAILEHNQLDLKIYEAAVKQFERQKRALGMEDSGGNV